MLPFVTRTGRSCDIYVEDLRTRQELWLSLDCSRRSKPAGSPAKLHGLHGATAKHIFLSHELGFFVHWPN